MLNLKLGIKVHDLILPNQKQPIMFFFFIVVLVGY